MADLKILKAQLYQQLYMIAEPNEKFIKEAWDRWDSIVAPQRKLGALERVIAKIAGMGMNGSTKIDKKALVVLCGDHGVAAELPGIMIEETEKSVQALTAGTRLVNRMATKADISIYPVDMGMAGKYFDNNAFAELAVCNRKKDQGTGNIAAEPAMSEEKAIQAILTGIEIVSELSDQGVNMIGVGTLGCGSEISASALISVLLSLPADEVTGLGAGYMNDDMEKRVAVIEQAVNRYWKATEEFNIADGPFFKVDTAIELLSHLGGYEMAGLIGLYLGGAIYGVPVVLDGYVSIAAALIASLIKQESTGWILASHVSAEKGTIQALRNLHLEPVINAGMCFGEGTGAIAAMELYDLAMAVYNNV